MSKSQQSVEAFEIDSSHVAVSANVDEAISRAQSWYERACSKELHGLLSGAWEIETQVSKKQKKFESYVTEMAEALKDSLNQRQRESEEQYAERRKKVARQQAVSLLTLIGKESVMTGSKWDKAIDLVQQGFVKLVNAVVNGWKNLKKSIQEFWALPRQEKIDRIKQAFVKAGGAIKNAWQDLKEYTSIQIEKGAIVVREKLEERAIGKAEKSSAQHLARLSYADQGKVRQAREGFNTFIASAREKSQQDLAARRDVVQSRTQALKERREKRSGKGQAVKQ